MKEIVSENKCTGCTACMNICPKQAIAMEENIEGFKYPVINQEKCINCGLCKRTCPILTTNKNMSINKCYVGYAKEDEVKRNSSSGGIFPLVANYILDNNGIVIGAAFDDNNKLNHIAITKEKELIKLKGSKYLQSNLGDIFKYVSENILNTKILFVGVPCQIAGLKAFLKKEYENLICVDLICHGAPSPKLFDKYIKELEKKKNDKLINYNFRDKSTGWDTYSNTAIFKNSKITELQTENKYMKLFLSDVALRKSCFKCNFKLGNKYSDITLGDFWGVQNYYPKMYNKKGVSAIIINTSKGEKIFNEINGYIEYEKCKLEEIVAGNPLLKESAEYNKKGRKIFKEIDLVSVDELVKKYGHKRNTLWKRGLRKVKNMIKKLKCIL